MGRNVQITVGCQLNGGGGITIQDDVMIGPGSLVWSQNHCYHNSDVLITEQGYNQKSVLIEEDVWIAAGCIILPGVRLGRGTVVAAGAVVTKSTDPYTVVGGIPARIIGRRQSGPIVPSRPTP